MPFINKFMLTGKKVVVTGGARGIGQDVAVALADVGADVAILDILDSSETVAKIKALDRDSFGIITDVADEKSVTEAFKTIEDRFSRVDVLFNNAGICIMKPAEEMTYDEWKQVIAINLNAIYLVARTAGKIMIKNGKGGSIISTASMSGHIVNVPQEHCSYNATKAGVIQLTKSLAVEWAKYNIRVNALSPGYTITPMSVRCNTEWRDTKWIPMTPMNRMCVPDELAGAVIYLASDASTFTTGIDMVVDGGYTCL